MNTITIENLSIGYKNKVIGTGLNAEIRGGQLTCLLGTNGVGKSTLLRTIARLQPSLRGAVVLHCDKMRKTSVADLPKNEIARLVSVVLTEQPDVQHFTVTEMVGMGRLPYTGFFGALGSEDRQIVARSLAAVGLENLAGRQFDALSDGERQKVMIAKALAQQTPFILLDEPTAFLDYPSKVEMMKLLHCLAADVGRTILLSTHDLELAFQHADCLLTLKQGLHETPKEELKDYMQRLK